jgi:hypothetical protein
MNHDLILSLELLEQEAWGFRFRMTAENRSRVKLLLPSPEIIGIRFGNVETMKEAEWFTGLLVSAARGEFALQTSESRSFEWRVRPCDVERPESTDDFNYFRWCTEIPIGNYLVWYQWRVDENYFAPDSHMKLPNLESVAKREGAVVWMGQALSNRIRVSRS